MDLGRKEFLQLAAVVAAAALFGIVLRAEKPVGRNVADNATVRAVQQDQSSPSDDNPAADLTLTVFSDYRCPACRAAHPAMKRAVESDGKVRIVYKDWPIFGEASERAAQVALAANFQNIYPAVHDRLMTGPTSNGDALRSAVERSGGDWRRLQGDLATRRSEITAQLERNAQQAFGLGLGGTPGYLIGPILVRGALDEAEFRRTFKKARQER
ncbi:MAG: DsbA family protein [Sphingomonas sp.]|nr:DsbA family protein [Sphingomonas sp.]